MDEPGTASLQAGRQVRTPAGEEHARALLTGSSGLVQCEHRLAGARPTLDQHPRVVGGCAHDTELLRGQSRQFLVDTMCLECERRMQVQIPPQVVDHPIAVCSGVRPPF